MENNKIGKFILIDIMIFKLSNNKKNQFDYQCFMNIFFNLSNKSAVKKPRTNHFDNKYKYVFGLYFLALLLVQLSL